MAGVHARTEIDTFVGVQCVHSCVARSRRWTTIHFQTFSFRESPRCDTAVLEKVIQAFGESRKRVILWLRSSSRREGVASVGTSFCLLITKVVRVLLSYNYVPISVVK